MRKSPSRPLEQSLPLYRRLQEGDGRALDRLFGRSQDRLLAVIRRRLGREMRLKVESMDVLQDVWVDALGDIGAFRPRGAGSFLRWLSARVENKIRNLYDRFHAARRDMRVEESLPPGLEPAGLPFRDPSPSALCLAQERGRSFLRALDDLDAEARRVVLLRVHEDLPFKEIGRRRGKSEDAVRMTYARALLKMSARLGAP